MSYKSSNQTILRLPLTPTNFPMYYSQIARHAEHLNTAKQKQAYARHLLTDLWQFVDETQPYHGNQLTPIVSQWLSKAHAPKPNADPLAKHPKFSLDTVINGLKQIDKQNEHLIL